MENRYTAALYNFNSDDFGKIAVLLAEYDIKAIRPAGTSEELAPEEKLLAILVYARDGEEIGRHLYSAGNSMPDNCPVLYFVDKNDGSAIEAAYNSGADDVLHFPPIEVEFRKKIMQAIQDSSSAANYFNERLPSATVTLDDDLRVVNVSDSIKDILGCDSKTCRSKYFPDYINSEDRAEGKEFFREVLLGHSGSFFCRMYDVNSAERKVLIFAKQIESDEDEADCFSARLIDFSLSTDIESVLYNEKDRYKRIVRTLPDLIFRINDKGQFIDFEVSDPNQLLLPKDQIVGKYLEDLPLTEEYRSNIRKAIKTALNTDDIQIVEYDWLFGRKREYFEARIIKAGDHEVLSLVRDITDNRLLEQEQQRRMFQAGRFQYAYKTLFGQNFYHFDEAVKAILKTVASAMQLERTGLWIYDSDGKPISSLVYHFEDEEYIDVKDITESDVELFHNEFKDHRTIDFADAVDDPRLTDYRDYFYDKGLKSVMVAGVRLSDKIIGSLMMATTSEKRNWNYQEKEFAGSVADRISLEIESNEKRKAQQSLAENAIKGMKYKSLITELFKARFDNMDKALEFILPKAAESLDAERSFYWIIDTDMDKISCRKIFDNTGRIEFDHKKIENDNLPKMIDFFSKEKIHQFEDISEDPIVELCPPCMKSGNPKSSLYITLKKDNSIYAMISFVRIDESKPWSDQDIDFASTVSDIVTIEIEAEQNRESRRALSDSEERFRAFIEKSNNVIHSIDEDGILTYISPNVYNITGFTPEQLTGRKFDEVTHPDDLRKCYEYLDKVLYQKKHPSEDVRYRLRDKNGEWKWYRTSGTRVERSGDKSAYFLGVAHDIDYRVRAEQRIIENQQILSTIFSTVKVGIMLTDERGNIIETNMEMLRITGHSYEDIIDRPMFSLFEDITEDGARKYYDKILKKGYMGTDFSKIKTKDGETKNVSISYGSVLREDSRRFVVSAISDITESMHHAEQLRFSNAVLKNQQETSPFGIMVVDKNGEIVTINNKLVELFGIPEESINNYFKINQYVAGLVDKSVKLVNIREYAAQKRKDIISNEFRLKDGRIFHRHIAPMIDSEGRYYGGVLYISDVTEQKRNEQELREAKEKAEQADRIKTEFLTNMSHEIRTPLNSIIGFAQLLGENLDNPKHLSHTRAIASSGKNLLNLINDILDIAKIEAGRMAINYRTFGPDMLFSEITYIFESRCRDKGLKFRMEVSPDMPERIVFDKVRLRQILFNLVGNAVKFTSQGYVAVFVDSDQSSKNIIDMKIRIEDTGPGIDTEYIDNIYKAFDQQQTGLTKKHGGTGLGLAITKRLVSMLNGEIDFETSEKGTKFFLKFENILISEFDECIEESKDEIRGPEKVVFAGNTVLVADDTELNRILVKDYLAGTDLNIIEAADGAEAIEQTKKHRPALVILDLNMPGTSGYDAAKQLKSDKTTLDIPVIALSAENPEESMSDLKKSGFDGYLSKPLSRKMLIGELAKFLKTEEFAENDQSNSWNGDDYIQSLDALGNDEKQRFLEIYDRIENEYMTKWKKVSSSAVIRDIKAFGEKIAELGKSNKIEPLYVYGRKLTTEADNFEFDKFPNTLNEFKELIEKMKELSE